MFIPNNLIINADDLGHSSSINQAILYCYQNEYINSTSLMTNTDGYKDAVEIIHSNPCIINIGLHVNLIEFKPLTAFKQKQYLDQNGEWDYQKIHKVFNYFDSTTKSAFIDEIHAQIDKALNDNVRITHLDSHLHIHSLPCFFELFLETAKRYKLKLRLLQSYNEGNYIKYHYRHYCNNVIINNASNYSDYFVTVNSLFDDNNQLKSGSTGVREVMLHPNFTPEGLLVDTFDDRSLQKWVQFSKQHGMELAG
jgi:predicted glycoside hydrolase/deacetylase ChbG (UPF0249 family)